MPEDQVTARRGIPAVDDPVRAQALTPLQFRQPGTVEKVPSWPHDELVHAWWVEKGKLLAGEYPFSPNDPDRARQKLRVLLDAGVDSLVDLTHPDDVPFMHPYTDVLPEEAEKAARPQPHYRRFPILDTGTVSPDGYDEILAHIQGEIDAGRIVYVHCWGGKGRTSTVIGCRLIEGGLDYEATMAALHHLRAGTRKAQHPVPDTEAQHRVLRDRAARHERDRILQHPRQREALEAECRSGIRRTGHGAGEALVDQK